MDGKGILRRLTVVAVALAVAAVTSIRVLKRLWHGAASANERAEKPYAWLVSAAWRGDARLFARMIRKAQYELAIRRYPADSKLQFVTQDDLETYEDLDQFLNQVPASTLRSFDAALIRLGASPVLVEIRLGRRRKPPHVLPNSRGVNMRYALFVTRLPRRLAAGPGKPSAPQASGRRTFTRAPRRL
jgi:hypothetical protein